MAHAAHSYRCRHCPHRRIREAFLYSEVVDICFQLIRDHLRFKAAERPVPCRISLNGGTIYGSIERIER